MDTTVPPTQHQQNHDPTNMEKCEMPNAVNVTDNNVNGGGRGQYFHGRVWPSIVKPKRISLC